MATSPAETLARLKPTYQDVLNAPAHQVAEIINGTLYTHPRPAVPHTRASSVLGRKIGAPYDDEVGGPGGWWIHDEPELHLGDDILVPDLAGWRRERMPELPDTAYVTDRTLEAFELHEAQWLLIGSAKDDAPVSIRPFDAVSFSLGDLWP